MSKLNMKNFEEMIGKEYTVLDFSNELIDLGCSDIYENGDLKYLIKEVNSIAVTPNVYDETFETYKEVDFQFDVIKDSEDIHEVEIKITNVSEL